MSGKKTMRTDWSLPDAQTELLILAGDVGGTNTSLALVGRRNRSFLVLGKFLFKTRELGSFTEAVEHSLVEIERKRGSRNVDLCCVSAAGPVAGNRCVMTNAPWEISGNEIAAILGAKTAVINDFSAISYGLPLLDTDDPDKLLVLPRPDGRTPQAWGNLRAVVGAGTGLGVGFLLEDHGRYIACPSEGGHIDFGGFDEETRELSRYVEKRIGAIPEAELFISGQGIVNIYRFLAEKRKVSPGSEAAQILLAEDGEIPALVSAGAGKIPLCTEAIRLFVKLYARFAAGVAATFLPGAGLYLAGGIAAKNEKYLLEDGLFMKTFSQGYRKGIRDTLAEIPVYLVKDYGISLLGAANAAYSLL